MTEALYSGEQIKKLIPQREPMIMVDTLYSVSEETCHTGLTITADNIFCINGYFEVPGLIEHIAQSASACMGYNNRIKNNNPAIGYIGEVKKFKAYEKVCAGERLFTEISIKTRIMNITLIEATVQRDGVTVATCQMKIATEEV